MRRQVEPAELRLLDGRASEAAAPAHVQEAELFERDRRCERDDDEADAPDSQGRDCDEQADDRGRERADQKRNRKRRPHPAEVGRQVGHRETRDAGERELHD
jgi:hypothetical protein